MRFYLDEDILFPAFYKHIIQHFEIRKNTELDLVSAQIVHWLKAERVSDTPIIFVNFLIFNFFNPIRHLFTVHRLIWQQTPDLTFKVNL